MRPYRVLLALALGAVPTVALAQDDAAPLNPVELAVPREPCAAVHRTSPEFLAAFAALPAEIVDGDAGDPLAVAFSPAAGPPAASAPAVGRPAASAPAERLLASAMLPTKRTSFDGQWRRVRDSGLDQACPALLLGAAPGGMRTETVAAVNRWVNRNVRYVEDAAGSDRWVEAAATLRDRQGDCEDIAVAKLQLLRALGVAPEDLYLTLARDLVRRSDHAVLVVRAGDRLWMLDNTTDRLLDAREGHDYRPVLSYSTDRKWLHGY